MFRVIEPIVTPPLPVRVTLCAALIKFDRFEWIVEKATELGVERILPVETTRSAGGDGGRPVVRITVADTGKGMSREELNRAFDDFYTTKPDGTGLGLSIVRRLVLDADGALRVETAPGAGSKFIVELPGEGE